MLLRNRLCCRVTCSLFALVIGLTTAQGAILSGKVTGPNGLGVGDAIVFLVGPKAGTPPRTHPVLEQRNQTFHPHVMAILVGTTVDFPNRDTVFHNVFSFRDGKKFDLGMYPVGASRSVKFDKPGLAKIFCNIHSNMSAFIYVLENPYFSVTDSDGSFAIRNAPEGEFTLKVWHENHREKSQPVTVRGSRISVNLQLSR